MAKGRKKQVRTIDDMVTAVTGTLEALSKMEELKEEIQNAVDKRQAALDAIVKAEKELDEADNEIKTLDGMLQAMLTGNTPASVKQEVKPRAKKGELEKAILDVLTDDWQSTKDITTAVAAKNVITTNISSKLTKMYNDKKIEKHPDKNGFYRKKQVQ